jgi:hypothetical protein
VCRKREGIGEREYKGLRTEKDMEIWSRIHGKKKIKFSSYIKKFRGIGCIVIYD